MEISSDRWFSDLEMEDYNFIDACNVNSLDEFTAEHITAALGEELRRQARSLSSDHESYSSYPSLNPETTASTTFSASSVETIFGRPQKQLKITNSWTLDSKQQAIPKPSSSSLLSFMNNNSSSPASTHHQYYQDSCSMKLKGEIMSHGNLKFQSKGSNENQSYVPKGNQQQGTTTNKRVTPMKRSNSHSQDHIMAERRRREKLSQRFIALSALVPGLKKMDKASVLGDAIKYVKQLQERVTSLEEQMKESKVESVVFIKKSQLISSSEDHETSSCDENFDGCSEEAVRDIEARVSDKNVLIRIHCKKQKGFIAKILSEIEEHHHLCVLNSSVLPFGTYAMDITVVAQMGDEFHLTVKDLVKNLRVAFLKLM